MSSGTSLLGKRQNQFTWIHSTKGWCILGSALNRGEGQTHVALQSIGFCPDQYNWIEADSNRCLESVRLSQLSWLCRSVTTALFLVSLVCFVKSWPFLRMGIYRLFTHHAMNGLCPFLSVDSTTKAGGVIWRLSCHLPWKSQAGSATLDGRPMGEPKTKTDGSLQRSDAEESVGKCKKMLARLDVTVLWMENIWRNGGFYESLSWNNTCKNPIGVHD